MEQRIDLYVVVVRQGIHYTHPKTTECQGFTCGFLLLGTKLRYFTPQSNMLTMYYHQSRTHLKRHSTEKCEVFYNKSATSIGLIVNENKEVSI